MFSVVSIILGNTPINVARRSLSRLCYLYFKSKNQKIFNLIKRKIKSCNTNYSILIRNLSSYNVSNQERQKLKLHLNYHLLIETKAFGDF